MNCIKQWKIFRNSMITGEARKNIGKVESRQITVKHGKLGEHEYLLNKA